MIISEFALLPGAAAVKYEIARLFGVTLVRLEMI
jgi:hypothetical protein